MPKYCIVLPPHLEEIQRVRGEVPREAHNLQTPVRFRNPQQNNKTSTEKCWFCYFVAGSGIEPESGGYAYRYSFRYSHECVCGLDYTFIFFDYSNEDAYHLVSTPSEVITYQGLARYCHVCAFTPRRFHRIWQDIHTSFLVYQPNLSLPRYLSSNPLYFLQVRWQDYTIFGHIMQLNFSDLSKVIIVI